MVPGHLVPLAERVTPGIAMRLARWFPWSIDFRKKKVDLVGLWQGQLKISGYLDAYYKVDLIVARQTNGTIAAALCYEGFQRTELMCRGLDLLRNYSNNCFNQSLGTWTPYFERSVHAWMKNTAPPLRKNKFSASGATYQWDCTLVRTNGVAEMKVMVFVGLDRGNMCFEGTLLAT